MAFSKSTPNYGLPQYQANDPTSWYDLNGAFSTIDRVMSENATNIKGVSSSTDAAQQAADTAQKAATSAKGSADSALQQATAATTAAQSAVSVAGSAEDTAERALAVANENTGKITTAQQDIADIKQKNTEQDGSITTATQNAAAAQTAAGAADTKAEQAKTAADTATQTANSANAAASAVQSELTALREGMACEINPAGLVTMGSLGGVFQAISNEFFEGFSASGHLAGADTLTGYVLFTVLGNPLNLEQAAALNGDTDIKIAAYAAVKGTNAGFVQAFYDGTKTNYYIIKADGTASDDVDFYVSALYPAEAGE